MQRLTNVVSMSLSHYYGKRPYQQCLLVNVQFRKCTNLAFRPLTMIFGLGTKLHLRMHTRLENGVLCNR